MPLLTSPQTGTPYYLVAFDKDGAERREDDGLTMSERIGREYAQKPPSDIFIFSHGWSNDVPLAIQSYGGWVDLMVGQAESIAAARARPGWNPLLVGIHWPSQPWGREKLPPSVTSRSMSTLVNTYAARTAETPAAKEAITAIIERAKTDPLPSRLPADVAQAAIQLEREALPPGQGSGAAPGSDRAAFKPEEVYQRLQDEAGGATEGTASFGSDKRSVLDFVRLFSFWKMKDRARAIGETGCHQFLRQLQTLGGPDARIHLMGHSFGCIVVSAMVSGPHEQSGLALPVHSVTLVQGALSCWAYCPSLPAKPDRPGYFHGLRAKKRVAGPMLSLYSVYDTAVGLFYRLGAGMVLQMDYADKPSWFGALGAFGAQNIDAVPIYLPRKATPLGLEMGRAYNINAVEVIKRKSGAEGAHNDIVHAEVARAVWEAALAKPA